MPVFQTKPRTILFTMPQDCLDCVQWNMTVLVLSVEFHANLYADTLCPSEFDDESDFEFFGSPTPTPEPVARGRGSGRPRGHGGRRGIA